MLNLIWLKSLITVIEQHSFQAAASQLGLAQPTITQHIQKLEEMLKVSLIQRGRSGCQPTEHALRLLPYAESMLRLQDRALLAIKSPKLKVGASSNIGIYLLQPYLHDFLRHQSQEEDKLDLLIDNNPTVADKLENAEIDIALMEWWSSKAGFESQTWKIEPLVLITPTDHPLAKLPSISKSILAGLDLIGGEWNRSIAKNVFTGFSADAQSHNATRKHRGCETGSSGGAGYLTGICLCRCR